MAISEKNLPELRKYLSTEPFDAKFRQTTQLVKRFDGLDYQENLNVLKTLYEDICYEFPFNYTQWNKYAQIYHSINQPDECLRIYTEAVNMNPTNIGLWNQYCLYNFQLYSENEPEKVIQAFEKAIDNVCFDRESYKVFESYLNYLEEGQNFQARTDELYWRLLQYPMQNIDVFVERYGKFLKNLEQPVYENILNGHQDLGITPDSVNYDLALDNRETLKDLFKSKFNSSQTNLSFADSKNKFVEILDGKSEYEGQEPDYKQEKSIFYYLDQQAKNNLITHEQLVFLYQKFLTAMSCNGKYWIKLIQLVDKEESTRHLFDEFLKKYDRHLKIINNKEPIFLLRADLYEKAGDIEASRDCYKQVEEKKSFEAYIRHIYFEIRNNQSDNAIKIFDSLKDLITDGDQAAFVIQEMGEILIKLNEADKAFDIIKHYHTKQTQYSKFFYITWVNFLKKCQKPWEDIQQVFTTALEKVQKSHERHQLWKTYIYTARSYCKDISTIIDIERQYNAQKDKEFEQPQTQQQDSGVNSKRTHGATEQDNEEVQEGDQVRKQVKPDEEYKVGEDDQNQQQQMYQQQQPGAEGQDQYGQYGGDYQQNGNYPVQGEGEAPN